MVARPKEQTMMNDSHYKNAGVDIHTAQQTLNSVKSSIEKTHNANVLSSIGGFAALFDLTDIKQTYQHPVMVQSIDGIGTKSRIAMMTQNYTSIGHDLVSATCNDIIVTGAKPLTLLDYIASDRLEPNNIVQIIESISAACLACGVSLVGGETAEMPDIYHNNEHDIVGIVTGIVERDRIINGPQSITIGDKIIGIGSSGLHTNGYSLARHVLFKQHELSLEATHKILRSNLTTALMQPHINYTLPILAALDAGCNIHGMAHITGGGLIDNIPRVLPADTNAVIIKSTWQPLPIFNLIQNLGNIDPLEMFRVFNMGIGYVCILPEDDSIQLKSILKESGLNTYDIGHIVSGNKAVSLV